MKCSRMIVTRGPYGSDGYFKSQGFLNSPALTDKIVDRVGAGDDDGFSGGLAGWQGGKSDGDFLLDLFQIFWGVANA